LLKDLENHLIFFTLLIRQDDILNYYILFLIFLKHINIFLQIIFSIIFYSVFFAVHFCSEIAKQICMCAFWRIRGLVDGWVPGRSWLPGISRKTDDVAKEEGQLAFGHCHLNIKRIWKLHSQRATEWALATRAGLMGPDGNICSVPVGLVKFSVCQIQFQHSKLETPNCQSIDHFESFIVFNKSTGICILTWGKGLFNWVNVQEFSNLI